MGSVVGRFGFVGVALSNGSLIIAFRSGNSGRWDFWHQVLWNVFMCGCSGLSCFQIFKVVRVIFKVSLQAPPSVGHTRASRMAYRVTVRNASSIRYRSAPTSFLSNTYSRMRPCCARSMRSHTRSSCRVLGTPPTALCLPNSELGSTKERGVPPRPARAVRPTR
jgi:hypothetical protein